MKKKRKIGNRRRNKKIIAIRPDMEYTGHVSLGLTNDVIFKYVFGSKDSIPILTDLINAVLADSGFAKIVSVSLKNPVAPRAVNWLKGTELDILGEDQNGTQYDIEMQVSDEPNFKNRSLFYWARLYSGQLKKGDEYTELKPVICINLIDFVLVKNPAIFHSCYMLTDKNIPDAVLTTDLQIHFIELPKSAEFKGKLADWARLLRESDEYAPEEKMEVIIKKDEAMEEAYGRFRSCLSDRRAYFEALMREKWQRDQLSRRKAAEREGRAAGLQQGLEQGMQQGLQQGIQKGLEEGLQQGLQQGLEQGIQQGLEQGVMAAKLEMAKKFKQDGIPAAAIVKNTGLSLEEVEGL